MEVAFTTHNINNKISNDEVIVTLTNVRTGVTLHWSWNRSALDKKVVLDNINQSDDLDTIMSLLAYSNMTQAEKAKCIYSVLHSIDSLSGEAESNAIDNLGKMLILPYVLDSKAWQMMQHPATANHNTVSILVDYDHTGYVLRPMATAYSETYSDALDKGVAQAIQTARMTGWLKQVNGQWTLLNNEGMSIESIKMQRGGTNMTPKKNKRKK